MNWDIDDKDIHVGDTVYYFEDCLIDGAIIEMTITHKFDQDSKGWFYKTNTGKTIRAWDVETDPESAIASAENARKLKIKQMETDLDFLKRKTFRIVKA